MEHRRLMGRDEQAILRAVGDASEERIREFVSNFDDRVGMPIEEARSLALEIAFDGAEEGQPVALIVDLLT